MPVGAMGDSPRHDRGLLVGAIAGLRGEANGRERTAAVHTERRRIPQASDGGGTRKHMIIIDGEKHEDCPACKGTGAGRNSHDCCFVSSAECETHRCERCEGTGIIPCAGTGKAKGG
jgi:hypothetical protein